MSIRYTSGYTYTDRRNCKGKGSCKKQSGNVLTRKPGEVTTTLTSSKSSLTHFELVNKNLVNRTSCSLANKSVENVLIIQRKS